MRVNWVDAPVDIISGTCPAPPRRSRPAPASRVTSQPRTSHGGHGDPRDNQCDVITSRGPCVSESRCGMRLGSRSPGQTITGGHGSGHGAVTGAVTGRSRTRILIGTLRPVATVTMTFLPARGAGRGRGGGVCVLVCSCVCVRARTRETRLSGPSPPSSAETPPPLLSRVQGRGPVTGAVPRHGAGLSKGVSKGVGPL